MKRRLPRQSPFCEILYLSGGGKTIPPASVLALAKEQFQQVAGVPALGAESTQAALAAAGNGSLPGKFFQTEAAHFGTFFRVYGGKHVEIAAAPGLAAGVFRLAAVTAAQGQQGSGGSLLFRLLPGGAGIMPDKAAFRCGNIRFRQVLCQNRPDGHNGEALQLPQLQGAVGTGGVDPLNALLFQLFHFSFFPFSLSILYNT